MRTIRCFEDEHVQTRDFFILYAVRAKPGIAGAPLAHRLGFATRSLIGPALKRLLRRGWMEDRRPPGGHELAPQQLYITDAGREFLAKIERMLEPVNDSEGSS